MTGCHTGPTEMQFHINRCHISERVSERVSERERETEGQEGIKHEEACNKSQLVFRLPWEQRAIHGLVWKTDRKALLLLFSFILWSVESIPLSPEVHVLGVHVCCCVRKLGNDLIIRRQQEEPERWKNTETRPLSDISPPNNDQPTAPPSLSLFPCTDEKQWRRQFAMNAIISALKGY